MKKWLLWGIASFLCCHLTAELPPSAREIAKKHEQALSLEARSQIQSALAAFHTLIASEVTYVSCPITSGSRLYQYMDTYGYSTLEEAMGNKERYTQNVVIPNLEESAQVTAALAKTLPGVIMTPTAFEKGFHLLQKGDKALSLRWGQHEFMSLWLQAIEHTITRIVFVDGWQYSSGASEEFLWASLLQMGFMDRSSMSLLDAEGHPLTLDRGATLLYEAILEVEGRGLRATSLKEVLRALIEAERIFYHFPDGSAKVPNYDHAAIDAIAKVL